MKSLAIVSAEYKPLLAAGAARIIPWVNVLVSLGFNPIVYSSQSVVKEKNLVKRSFFKTPSNRKSLFYRLCQEILLGFDLGLRILFNRSDIKLCIITSPPFFMACLCVMFARLARVPYIFDVRDRYPRVLEDLGLCCLSSLLGRLLQSIELWVYTGASEITTVTKGLQLELKNNLPKPNISLLSNGYDERIFTEDILKKNKVSNFTVIYHGRLGRFYDLHHYLSVMRLVEKADSSIRFLMIGDLPKEQISDKFGNLTVLPPHNLHDLALQLASCHLGLCLLKDLPAMKNAFPAKAYDYIGAGLPMLVGSNGEFANEVERMGCGVSINNFSADEIAKTIIELKNNPKRLSILRDQTLLHRPAFGRHKLAREYFSSHLVNFDNRCLRNPSIGI